MRPEKVSLNKAVVCLSLAGFGPREAGRLLHIDHGNLIRKLQRYRNKYKPEILDAIKGRVKSA